MKLDEKQIEGMRREYEHAKRGEISHQDALAKVVQFIYRDDPAAVRVIVEAKRRAEAAYRDGLKELLRDALNIGDCGKCGLPRSPENVCDTSGCLHEGFGPDTWKNQ